jgi:hypothetical protein
MTGQMVLAAPFGLLTEFYAGASMITFNTSAPFQV